MILIKNTLFNDKYIIFEEEKDDINNYGILNLDWQIIIPTQYKSIYDTNLGYAIISKTIMDENNYDTYYGILDENLNLIIDPAFKDYEGNEGYNKILKLIDIMADKNIIIKPKQEEINHTKILKPSLKRKQK